MDWCKGCWFGANGVFLEKSRLTPRQGWKDQQVFDKQLIPTRNYWYLRPQNPGDPGTYILVPLSMVFLDGEVKEVCLQCRRRGFDPWVGKIPWRSVWQPTPVFLPGELHGQRSLVSYGACGCKELDTAIDEHFYFLLLKQIAKVSFCPLQPVNLSEADIFWF